MKFVFRIVGVIDAYAQLNKTEILIQMCNRNLQVLLTSKSKRNTFGWLHHRILFRTSEQADWLLQLRLVSLIL